MRAIGAVVASILNSLFNGYVFWKLWLWFLTPIGVPEITYFHAYAIGFFGTWLSILSYTDHGGDFAVIKSRANSVFIGRFMAMVILLLVGWFVHLFLM